MNRIKFLRDEFNMTQKELANQTNLSEGSISLYEKEERKPSLEVLIKLSEIFDCSIDYLLCKSDIRNPGKTVKDVNEMSVNDLNNITVKDFINSFNKKNIDINPKPGSNVFPIPEAVVKVPIVGKIAAGIPILAIENIVDYAFAPASQIKEGFEYFYLYVEGDSMNLKFNEGDLILIQQQDYLENKEIGVFLIDKEDATVKQFREQKGNILILDPMSSNPINHTQMYDIKETPVKIIGKVISYQGKI